MAIILLIDSANEYAHLGLSINSTIVAAINSELPQNHASFLQPAIQSIFQSLSLSLNAIDAIAVSNGPGSYTGLRVGLSTAKGLAYVLKKPLILLDTLQIMAFTLYRQKYLDKALYCPMIDARRQEVFTGIYTPFDMLLSPQPMILESNAFQHFLEKEKIIFGGSGAKKFELLLATKPTFFNNNALFVELQSTAADMLYLAEKSFALKDFADLAYCQPFYRKEFYSPSKE